MSACVGSIPSFENSCESAASSVLTAWANNVRVYYDGSPFSKRDFVLSARHSWGTAYCNWSDDKKDLFDALRAVGATNIIGKVTWNYVDVAFDISKRKLKEYNAK